MGSGRGLRRDLIGFDDNGGSSKLRRIGEERDEKDEYEGNYRMGFYWKGLFFYRYKRVRVFDASLQRKIHSKQLLTHRNSGRSGSSILLSPFQDLTALAAQQEALEAHKPLNRLSELK